MRVGEVDTYDGLGDRLTKGMWHVGSTRIFYSFWAPPLITLCPFMSDPRVGPLSRQLAPFAQVIGTESLWKIMYGNCLHDEEMLIGLEDAMHTCEKRSREDPCRRRRLSLHWISSR